MRAIWLENQNPSYRSDLSQPIPAPGQALVRVLLAGVCSTDIELLRGYYPFNGIPGHEFVGQVVAAPDAPAWVGQRVVGEINIACGGCAACLAGNPTHCARRKVLGIRNWHGAFAEYLVLPLINLHRIPDSVTDQAAVFTEPLAAALEILQQVVILPSHRCLVVGAGRLGQLIAQVLSTTGCELKVVARHALQRELLQGRHIAWISEQQVGVGTVDFVVDATGTPLGFKLARQAVRPRGTIILKSTYQGEMSVNFSSLVVDELTLIGSRCGPFPPAIQLLIGAVVDPTHLIQAQFPLEDGLRALEFAAQPGVMKVLLNPWQDGGWH